MNRAPIQTNNNHGEAREEEAAGSAGRVGAGEAGGGGTREEQATEGVGGAGGVGARWTVEGRRGVECFDDLIQ